MGSALSALSCGSDPVAPNPGTQGEIVFQAQPEQDNSEIYLVKADGTGLRRLTNHPGQDVAPSWSSDGSQIYFSSSGRDGGLVPSLYAMDPDGSNVRLLLAHPPGGLHTWSPDGERIAFAFDTPSDGTINDGSPELELYVVQADGSNATRLVDFPGVCDLVSSYGSECARITSIAWSPDGRQLAFSTSRMGRFPTFNRYLWMINDDGTGWRRLTAGADFEPSWSPDGRRVVYASGGSDASVPAFSDILILDLASNQTVGIVYGEILENLTPSWSPDGGTIVFSRRPAGQDRKIFAVSTDGSGLRLLADVPGAVSPKWRPVTP
jgi:Tol biopolymer transport system component